MRVGDVMCDIVRRMWEDKMTVKLWVEKHGFNQHYCYSVIYGKCGKLNVGKAKEINEQLTKDGYRTEVSHG